MYIPVDDGIFQGISVIMVGGITIFIYGCIPYTMCVVGWRNYFRYLCVVQGLKYHFGTSLCCSRLWKYHFGTSLAKVDLIGLMANGVFILPYKFQDYSMFAIDDIF